MSRAQKAAAGAALLAALVAVAGGLWWFMIGGADPPRDAEVVYQDALADVEAERFDDASKQLERLATLRAPTPLDHGLRARVAIAKGRADEAIAQLAKIPDTHALADWARLRQGQLDLRRHRLPVAERAIREAIRLNPANIAARRELVYLLGVQLRRDELDAAFTELAARATLSPRETWVWCMVPDLVWWNPDESENYLSRCLEADPADRFSRLALAESHRRASRYDLAESTLAPLPEDDPDARALRANLALERSDLARAEAIVAGGSPEHPGLARVRGRLALGRRDAEAALNWFRVAYNAEPDRRVSRSDLARALVLAGRDDEAKPLLEEVERLDALGTLLLHAEEKVGAGPNADPRIVPPDDPALWKQLAGACEAAGRIPEARAWLMGVVRSNPLDTDAQKGLFRLESAERGNASEARPLGWLGARWTC